MNALYLNKAFLYPQAKLPYAVTSEQIEAAVNDFYAMFHDINSHSIGRGYGRLEMLMREATFSDFVGESLTRAVAKYCPALKRNLYNNGYPDLLSRADNSEDGRLRGVGMEVKASCSRGQWQAHNREAGWFLIFRFVADTATPDDLQAAPFEVVEILAAELSVHDWSVSKGAEGDFIADAEGNALARQAVQEVRSAAESGAINELAADIVTDEVQSKRRTRTTSTNAMGTLKLRSNPVYANSEYVVRHKNNPLWTRLQNTR